MSKYLEKVAFNMQQAQQMGSQLMGHLANSGKAGAQLAQDFANSPLTKGLVNSGLDTAKGVGKEVRDKLTTQAADHLMANAAPTIAKGIRKATGQPEPMSNLHKGLIAGGVGVGSLGLGAAGYHGYVHMNKEAAMSELLEQGHSVEGALYLVKEAVSNKARLAQRMAKRMESTLTESKAAAKEAKSATPKTTLSDEAVRNATTKAPATSTGPSKGAMAAGAGAGA